jgi:hypothetical protein
MECKIQFLYLNLQRVDVRLYEITLLKIKHIRLREIYGEGEIPYEAKTGSVPFFEIISSGNLQK